MRVVFGWNICCEERDKASFGQLFSFLGWIDFFAFFGNRPTLQKTLLLLLQNLREEAFSTFTLHNTPYWVDERERRGLQRARDGKSKTRVCVSSVVRSKEREREREREKLYCRILLLVEIENGKKRGTSLVDQREKNETRESDTVHGGNDGADDGAEEKQLRHEQVHAGVRFVG